jgi:hypothetical protein
MQSASRSSGREEEVKVTEVSQFMADQHMLS